VAGEEDFGIVAVEAQAAGKPVVAYGRGGACETVRDGVTGVLFKRQMLGDVVAAITTCEELDTAPEEIAQWAAQFSRAGFRAGIVRAIADARGELQGASTYEMSGVAA